MTEKVTIRYEGCSHWHALERPKEPTGIYHKPGCVCTLCVPGDEELREGVCGHCEHQGGYTGKLRFVSGFETHVRTLFANYKPELTAANFRQHRNTMQTFLRSLYIHTERMAKATLEAEYDARFKDQPHGDPKFAEWMERKEASLKQMKKLHKGYLEEIRIRFKG